METAAQTVTGGASRMGRPIRHFMWGYQQFYRVHSQVQAESVLRTLDANLQPEVFLVGILPEPTPSRHPACVEPEVELWIESEALVSTLDLASRLRPSYPEARMLQSHPLAQARGDEALVRRSVQDAVLQIIDSHPNKPSGVSFFASFPQLVNGYLVSVVLGVSTAALEHRYRLSSPTVAWPHEYRVTPVARSLIDAAIGELLTDAADGLLKPDPGLPTVDRRADEVLRSAARRLTMNTALRADPTAFEGFHALFETICAIASLRYERAEGHGKLVLARQGHDLIRQRVRFADTISLREHRRARKLLELASDESALHVNAQHIFALVHAEIPHPSPEDIFGIWIAGDHHWQLTHGPHILMGVRYGQPYLPSIEGYEPKLRQDLPRIFPAITDAGIEVLVSLVQRAERERHGTLLMISENASAESTRLRGQATPIQPTTLTPELLGDLTRIDGAVLLDPTGQCVAIGVILDGVATDQGDPARGARFNSALRYVQSAHERRVPTLAIVVSEDGGVDFIPNLRPRIRRDVITALIEELESAVRASDVPIRGYNRAYDRLRQLRFYLLPGDCVRLNNAIRAIEQRLRDDDPHGPRILREDFEAEASMVPSLYYEPE
jgi:sensor domain DACNG-containing protein/sensor domain DACNH-containing protein/DisA checkpoint controller-like protein